ncbi:hypothetical protein FUA48_01365 [Flavobacterium alkalisoli]|uniref:Uncharacterized protein n=1 Tax=Flavobacterium alkalisoli TaxID=2602769 RepID=A0A5B9FQ74_9FLAO|nr:hypothetical protein [Flavobacterium alkalisoli]QEE48271.1 hypothetical protein FUA48_01365 [Flavobacterium alkalisoli]
MEPNKWEKEIKEKLNKRTIQPGEMAWDRLDAMLSVAEKKKTPKYRWMYVAAGFLGFILAGTFFLNQQKTEEIIDNGTNTVVVAPETKESLKESTTLINTKEQEFKDAGEISNTTVASIEKTTVKKHTGTKKQEPVINTLAPQNTTITVVDVVKTEMLAENLSPDQEAEALLAETMNNMSASQQTKVKVSANSLLSEVEGELENNFRSKVWQTVTKNYNVVKTTVVNRNRE